MVKKSIGVVLIIVVQIFYLLGCASEEVRETVPDVKQISCTFNQLDGECKYFDNGATLCSTGTCSEGDCTTGKGVINYPGGSKMEGIFKDGKLNGAGSYQGCSESFVGTFKNDFKEKGFIFSNGTDKIYEGSFKDEQKNGNFNVYLDYNGQFPFAENGKIIAGVYSKKIVMPYVMDVDKNIYEEAESERKRYKKQEEDEQKKRIAEIKELKKILKEEKEQRLREEAEWRKRQEIEERKREKERIEEEKRDKAEEEKNKKTNELEEKAKRECIESRYKFSNECIKFEKKYNYNPSKEN